MRNELDRNPVQPKFTNIKVLLAEDNPNNQRLVEFLFETIDIKCTIANNGKEVLEKLQHESFDLVLMDMEMPVMDGITATRAIRAENRYDDLPIVAMTANSSTEDRDRCLEAGMNSFVAKPIEINRLIEVMNEFLGE